MAEPAQTSRIIRMPKVEWLTGLKAAVISRMVKDSRFPAPVRLHGNRIGWYRSEVDAWLRTRPRKHQVPREPGVVKQARRWPRGVEHAGRVT